ncbi:SF0329 family protein [Paenibacillus sp. BAC0078]
MDWSKQRVLIRSFITPDLKRRIDIHETRYHEAHDGFGEVWITLDGKKIFGGGYYHWHVNSLPEDAALQNGYHEDFYKTNIETEQIERVMKLGLHETSHITINLRKYLNTPFYEIMKSNNPIYKAFGIIDRRLGRRSFQRINLTENEHPLVKLFYELRKEQFER